MSTHRDNFEPTSPTAPTLDASTMLQIKALIADPIERSNREANEQMKAMLEEHVVEHDKKIAAHEVRLQWLEKNVGRALAAWSVIIVAATLVGRYTWDTFIKPVVFKR